MLDLRPNCEACGGGFVPRPIRPKDRLGKYPASTKRVVKPLDAARHAAFLASYRDVPPEPR